MNLSRSLSRILSVNHFAFRGNSFALARLPKLLVRCWKLNVGRWMFAFRFPTRPGSWVPMHAFKNKEGSL
jgi:hypothetical protein